MKPNSVNCGCESPYVLNTETQKCECPGNTKDVG